MKTLVSLSAALLAAAALLSLLPLGGEEMVYTDTIRLHVLAASDSEEDQARKLAVRDAVLAVLTPAVGSAHDVSEAARTIGSMQTEIREAAEAALHESGSEEPVTVLWGTETYGDRVYEDFTLPAGTYQSLRVVIGAGEGHNWWSLLFPNLCLRAAAEPAAVFREDGFSDTTVRTLVSGGGTIRVKWKIVSLLARLFS